MYNLNGKHRISQKKTLLCAMIGSSLLLSMVEIVSAAEQDSDQAHFLFDEMVVTANRVPTKVAEAAANITVVKREKIENGNYQNLGEVLRDVPGIIVTQYGFPGAGQSVRLNGDERVVILIDGRRMNMDHGASSGRSGYDLKNCPTLENIERIEVLQGGASALYGSDASGGVINIITRAGNKSSSTLNMETGSWGRHSYEFTNEGKQNDWSWFFTAGKEMQNHFAYKDFKTGQQKDMDNSGFNKDSMTFRLDKAIDENHSMTFNFEHVGENGGQPYMASGYKSPDTLWGPGELLHYPSDYEVSTTNNWAITYNFRKSQETAGLLRVYQNYYNSYFHSVSIGDYTDNNKATGVDWQNSWRLDSRNLLVGGAEWRDTKVNASDDYNNYSVNTRAIYAEDRMNLNDKWTLTPGIRYDHHNMFGNKTTSRATLNYKLNNTTNMYLSYNQLFNAPNTNDLFDKNYGNINLKPETGYKTTYGINKKINDNIEIKVSTFYSEINNAINYDPTNNYKVGNIDHQRRSGAEFQINDVLSPNWSVMAAYAYLKIENQHVTPNYILDPNNSGPNQYQLGVNYENELWNIGLVGRGASGRSLDNFSSSSYWVWNANINYKFNKTTRGYLKINNITNRAYEINGNVASNGGVGAFPMAGRNVQLGVQYQF